MRVSSVITVAGAALMYSAPAHGQSSAPGSDFPEGPGRDTVVQVCGGCHDINRAKAGYTPEGWHTIMAMKRNAQAPIPETMWETVETYLVKSFPEKTRPPAAIIAGSVEAEIKLWPVPTPGSRPHDPLAHSDGSIWWTGQLSNVMGRLNPKTGEVREYKLKSPYTGPHGLTEDKEGNIWFTGNHAALIGKIDPRTGDVTEYPMPDPAAKDPHSLAFDQHGFLWFTVQQANMVGRLDPKTREIKLLTSPTPKSRPYGILVNSKGTPIFVEFGTNKVASIDPQTMAIREWTLPAASARPRRLAIGPDDAIWYTDFARGFLGRLDSATGQVKEWPSPSGPNSQPYGIVWAKGALWYNESYAKPNTIVRFDPTAEKFQTWAIPGGGDIVRFMHVTRDGNPVTANSLVNQVGLIEVR